MINLLAVFHQYYSSVFAERRFTDVCELDSSALSLICIKSATKDSSNISINQIRSFRYHIKYLFEKSMRRKFINCILHFTVFSVLISESSAKISNFQSASCICFKSKLSNEFVSTMSIRRSNRLTLLLIECSESSACCRRFTLSSENFSRHRSSKML